MSFKGDRLMPNHEKQLQISAAAIQKKHYLNALENEDFEQTLRMISSGFDPTVGDARPANYKEYAKTILPRWVHRDVLLEAEDSAVFSDQFMAALISQQGIHLEKNDVDWILDRADQSNFFNLYQDEEKAEVFCDLSLGLARNGTYLDLGPWLQFFNYHLNDPLPGQGATVFGRIVFLGVYQEKFPEMLNGFLDAGADPYLAPPDGISAIDIAKIRSEEYLANIESILMRRSMATLPQADPHLCDAMNL